MIAVLAQSTPPAEEISAGPIGLLIVVLMVVATVFLIKNMNGRLRKLPREFPADGDGPPAQRTPEPPR